MKAKKPKSTKMAWWWGIIVVMGIIVCILVAVILNNKTAEKADELKPYDTSYANTFLYNDAALLVATLSDYITNNNGRLPSISGDTSIVNGWGGITDKDGIPYSMQFVSSTDASKIRGGDREMEIFYNSTCSEGGELVASSSKRHFAVVFVNTEKTGYYCIAGQ